MMEFKRRGLFNSKRGQVWSLDLVVAAVLFSFSIIILYVYAINHSSQIDSELEALFYEGNLASELILSNGESGILFDSRVDQNKLEILSSDYEYWKNQLGISNDFYFIIPNLEINGTPVERVGLYNEEEIDNLVQITRITIYKNSPVKFEFYIWN